MLDIKDKIKIKFWKVYEDNQTYAKSINIEYIWLVVNMWPKDDVSSQRMMEYCQKKIQKTQWTQEYWGQCEWSHQRKNCIAKNIFSNFGNLKPNFTTIY